jgi:prepilin-type N-terminal cleavage/methylation domain-containing protein
MSTAFRRSGFSLVELLTVIAIIAILAAIIFPVMGAVKRRAQENQCMTNLHQIALGVQLFKNDNRVYPRILGSEVRNIAGDPWHPGDTAKMFEQVKDKYLFAEYVKSIGAFHCPTSRISKSDEVVVCNGSSSPTEMLNVYAYDSYDCYVFGAGAGPFTEVGPSRAERHYMTTWAPAVSDVAAFKPYPPSTTDTLELQKDDYARQLRFRNPPGDTVVTWCSYHQTIENGGASLGGKTLVVFLDGHADQIPAAEMADCKWRVRPKKT